MSVSSLPKLFKHNARLALKNHWGKAVLVCLLSGLLFGVLGLAQQFLLGLFAPLPPTTQTFPLPLEESSVTLFRIAYRHSTAELAITSAFTLLSLLLLSPITLGSAGWFWELAQGRPAPVGNLFLCFASLRSWRRAVWYELSMTVRSLLWAVLFLSPAAGAFYSAYLLLVRYEREGERFFATCATVGLILASALGVLLLLLYLAFFNRYAASAYLVYSRPDLSVRQAIAQSIACTREHRFPLLWYQLSFAGWGLLSVLLLLLPLLLLIPYFNTATAMYARYLVEKSQFDARESTREFQLDRLMEEGGGGYREQT